MRIGQEIVAGSPTRTCAWWPHASDIPAAGYTVALSEPPLALLRHGPTATTTPLAAEHRIGRSSSSDLQIPHAAVSSDHARLRWTPAGWDIKDLGSRNGTTLDGVRLAPGVWTPVVEGNTLAFGSVEQAWILVDGRPPEAMALSLDGGPHRVSEGEEMLAFPAADSPTLLVVRGPSGWLAEVGAEVRPVVSGEVVETGGRRWRLYLPEHLVAPTASLAAPVALADTLLRFRVSRDEEHVEIVAETGSEHHNLGSRAHHYALLVLARARIADAADTSLGPAEHGWRYADALARQLRMDDRVLNVVLFRARRQLADAGFADATSLIQRRPAARQLRIGVSRLVVERPG